jgi:5-methyltetrahydrofolate--homocysteine methyltransferase
MKPLIERIAAGEVLVADGAIGTLLLERGLAPGACPESFNLSHPEVIEEIARLYLHAGAEIIQTNTFGGSPLKLARYGLDDQTEAINQAAAAAVRRVVGRHAYVSGSCGPCGRMLKPYGDTDPEAIRAGFERQMGALAEAGVDVFCVETMTDLAEAVLAVRAAKSVAPAIPVMATMTFERTRRGFFSIMGAGIDRAAAELTEAGADLVGSNCGNGIENMVEIAREFRRHTARPLIIQSNAGLPEIVDGRAVYPETPEFMAERARALIAIGVSILGGCCGTTPEHVAAFKRMVREATPGTVR